MYETKWLICLQRLPTESFFVNMELKQADAAAETHSNLHSIKSDLYVKGRLNSLGL